MELERRRLTLAYGHRAYVLGDLDLGSRSDPTARPLRELAALLEDLDEPATLIVAGNLIDPAGAAGSTAARRALDVVPRLTGALAAFARRPEHRVVALAGSRDAAVLADPAAQAVLAGAGIEVAREVILEVASAAETREVSVVAGASPAEAELADPADRDDAARLEDRGALARFVASRLLYRRLGPWVWMPVLALAAIDLTGVVARVIQHVLGHPVRVHAPHPHTFWANLALDVVVVTLAEGLLVGLAGLAVRSRFRRGAGPGAAATLAEPLATTTVEGIDALEVARRGAEGRGAGAIVGGAPRPALAFLDRGICAAPGPSGRVLLERRGRFGLPPVFSAADRFCVVEVEAASTLQVRLIGGESPRRPRRLLERLVASVPTQPALGEPTTVLGAWPSGNPFPVEADRLAAQRRRRSVRRLASGLIFLDGLINVAAAAAPPLRNRLHHVLSVLPLGVAQSAAAATALAGVALIMLARGVRRGQRRAWFLTSATLAVTVIAHLARGASLLSPVLASAILALLVTQREHFRAATDRSSLRSIWPRLALIALVSVGAASLGIEAAAGRHHLPAFRVVVVACVERLVGITVISLPQLPDRVGDLLTPTLAAIGLSLVVVALYLATRPVVDRRLSSARSAERGLAELRARELVRRHGRGTLDYFALRDDKQFFFFRDSLVAYAVYGGVALISPDPIGPEAERVEVFSAFRAYAEARGWTLGVMGASAEWLPLYHAAGLHSIYVGDEAVVDCRRFSLEGGKMKGLRQACSRLERHGYRVEFLDPATLDPTRVPALVELATKLRRGDVERGFSMMLGRLFDPRDRGLLLSVVTGPDGQPAAMCQFVPSPAIRGYSLDLMRRDPGEHPNGLIDFALCSTIAHLRERGAQGLSLNFAAFRSVLEGHEDEGTFTRVERWALKRLSGVLPIETLWTFNAKYQPDWLARYLVYPAAESFVPVAAAVFRAEALTELPVLGRFLAQDPANRPGTIVPPEVLERARRALARARGDDWPTA